MLILTPYLKWPAVGAVIKCENGHDAIRITGEAQSEDVWPDAERLDGTSIVGEWIPVCCDVCGAKVIDWDHRFVGIPLEELTRERVAEVLAA